MAAVSETRMPEVVELRHIPPDDLRDLLECEASEWRRDLDWDFRPSADLVRRFAGTSARNGFALLDASRVVGYAYAASEERKGLIGDLYILEEYRTALSENRLLEPVLHNLMRMPHLARIESQLMMLSSYLLRPFPRQEYLSRYPREFMEIERQRIAALPAGAAADRVLVEKWHDRWHDSAAHVIAAAYDGHVDSSINDQYRTAAGARRFLANIVQYPGCGRFFQPASHLALEPATGRLCGLSLTSLLAPDVGHITQICVTPAVKGTGVGYELLRRSLAALADAGCRKASLTVTTENRGAVRLYERVGFRTRRRFSAMVWEGFGS